MREARLNETTVDQSQCLVEALIILRQDRSEIIPAVDMVRSHLCQVLQEPNRFLRTAFLNAKIRDGEEQFRMVWVSFQAAGQDLICIVRNRVDENERPRK